MSDVDYGLILGSTNEDIWGEEVAKSAGTRALLKVMTCDSPQCGLSARQHAQAMFDDVETLKEACEFLAPHEHESLDALRDRLFDTFKPTGYPENPFELGGLLNVETRPDGSLNIFSPEGEEIPIDDLPAALRAAIEMTVKGLIGGDDEPEPKGPSTLH